MSSSPTRLSPADTAPVLAAVAEIADHAFGVAASIATTVERALAGRAAARRTDLAAVEPLVVPVLADLGQPVQGAGFVAAPGVLQDAEWWLEWFARDTEGRPQRLVTHSEPQAIGFYDYEHLPWFVVPRETGRQHVTGPYVDYLCTEEYTLTFTVPVLVEGRFCGVGGADVAVKNAEQALLPTLRASAHRIAVVNGFGRILSSNSGRHLCGDLLDGVAFDELPAGQRVGDLPLAVVALD
ncbi:cache domain-containing protein [Nocardioides sp. QY071]|uniref:cache domain-containing protein n=1 Tax=Nocardioides sp. QY071 TaxID=3044187 RepID=UPI00249CBD78|nr:cache domain-containing protein [Nocardioides sp. QY071]WGY02028.1 cache domain-containing protein [Nocardioides sp. QY071]